MARKETPCRVCGQPTLVKDIAEERSLYPVPRYEVMCKDCNEKRIAAAIAKTRKELGLP